LIGGGLFVTGFTNGTIPSIRWLFAIAAIAVFAVIQLSLSKRKQMAAISSHYRAAAARWRATQNEWSEHAGAKEFDEQLARLDRLSKERLALPTLRRQKLEKLQAEQWTSEESDFLSRFEIAQLPQISAAQKEVFAAHGVRTAADVTPDKLSWIPRQGRAARSKLEAWRRELEGEFVFDAHTPLATKALAQVEQELSGERWIIESALVSGAANLKGLRASIEAARKGLVDQVERDKISYLQTVADYRAAKR